MVNDLTTKNKILFESFVVVSLIKKLSSFQKDYKNNIKQKKKDISLEEIIISIRIKQTNRKQAILENANELVSKKNSVEILRKNSEKKREGGFKKYHNKK